jgi:hypothetical protein
MGDFLNAVEADVVPGEERAVAGRDAANERQSRWLDQTGVNLSIQTKYL